MQFVQDFFYKKRGCATLMKSVQTLLNLRQKNFKSVDAHSTVKKIIDDARQNKLLAELQMQTFMKYISIYHI